MFHVKLVNNLISETGVIGKIRAMLSLRPLRCFNLNFRSDDIDKSPPSYLPIYNVIDARVLATDVCP